MQSNPFLRHDITTCDVVIIGSGIVGLSSAASILERNPRKKVIVLERGLLPTGASTKNTGIVGVDCFVDVLEDLLTVDESKIRSTIESRQQGVKKLLSRLGVEGTDYQRNGSYELLTEKEIHHLEQIDRANKVLFPIFNDNVFTVANSKIKELGFNDEIVKGLVHNRFGAQIDSGRTISSLLKYVRRLGAIVITGAEATNYEKSPEGAIQINVRNPAANDKDSLVFSCTKLVIATNAFSNRLLKTKVDLIPARGQVMVTKPIPGLKFKGSFTFEEDYYYGRTIGNRVLIGGARNSDFQNEETEKFENSHVVTSNLMRVLKEVILKDQDFEIEHRWAGIMGFGRNTREKIIQEVEEDVYAGIRFSGSGKSLGSYVGEALSEMVLNNKIAISPKL